MELVIAALCLGGGIYFYVIVLCYLCDLYEAKKQNKREQEEMSRKKKFLEKRERREHKQKEATGQEKQMGRDDGRRVQTIARSQPHGPPEDPRARSARA